jgi:predicted nucleic acid-binding protein
MRALRSRLNRKELSRFGAVTRKRGLSFSPKVWNDAYLAAFAQAAAFDLVTFDRAFAQFKGVASTVLP